MDSCLRWHFLRCLATDLHFAEMGFEKRCRWGAEARRWKELAPSLGPEIADLSFEFQNCSSPA